MKGLWVCSIALLAACASDDNTDAPKEPTPAPIVGISLTINPLIADSAFSYNASYSLGNTLVKFNRVAFYLDSLGLVDANLQTTFSTGDPIQKLFDGDQGQTFETNIPSGNTYQALKGAIGLNRNVNGADPTLASYPLDRPNMHWGWNPMAGYKFAVFEGQFDSNLDGVVGAEDFYFAYHCATNDLYSPIELAIENFSGTSLQLDFDVAKIFVGVDIPAVYSQHGAGSTNTAIIENFETAFAQKP